jgi:hypothetical protein
LSVRRLSGTVVGKPADRIDGPLKPTSTAPKAREFPSSVLCQRTGQYCGVGERPQSLETSVADGPDVDEGDVDRDASLSRRSFDPPDRDDTLAPGDELFGDEMNVNSSIEAGEEALQ